MNAMKINYQDLEAVKKAARKLHRKHSPMVVIKQEGNDYYNITFKSRTDRYDAEQVVYDTSSEKD